MIDAIIKLEKEEEQVAICNTDNPSFFQYTHDSCKWEGYLIADSKGKVCLSDIQKHYKNDHYNKDINNCVSVSSKPMTQFFRPTSSTISTPLKTLPSKSTLIADPIDSILLLPQ